MYFTKIKFFKYEIIVFHGKQQYFFGINDFFIKKKECKTLYKCIKKKAIFQKLSFGQQPYCNKAFNFHIFAKFRFYVS